MTLVIALACKDGIVMASDGQVTGGSAGGYVRFHSQKIFKINNNVLFGASGNIGTIQRALAIIQAFSQQLEEEMDYQKMEQIRVELFKIYKNEIDRHKAFYKDMELESIKHAPISDIIISKFQDGEAFIWHISPDCSDELLQDIGYACTGNGDVFAYTILKNFNVKELDVEKGKLIAFRVIKEAIEIGAFGLGEPIDIWIVTDKGVKRLSTEEIEALEDSYLIWKRMEEKLFNKLYMEDENESN